MTRTLQAQQSSHPLHWQSGESTPTMTWTEGDAAAARRRGREAKIWSPLARSPETHRLGGSTTADDFSAHPNHRPSELVRPVSSWTPYASPEQLVAPMTSTSQASFLGTFGRPSTAIVPSPAIVPPSGDGCLPLRTRNQEMSDWVANQPLPPPTAAIQPRDALGLGGSFEDETEVAASFRPHPVMVAQPYEVGLQVAGGHFHPMLAVHSPKRVAGSRARALLTAASDGQACTELVVVARCMHSACELGCLRVTHAEGALAPRLALSMANEHGRLSVEVLDEAAEGKVVVWSCVLPRQLPERA
mmetsp:Transcript_3525/g.10318  ORF Transcript_3525/g.10318 Transcript_3525/m.10318 type:complete len:302 (-) Transcript_3525:75-980(-)